jgi:hypothetical protein
VSLPVALSAVCAAGALYRFSTDENARGWPFICKIDILMICMDFINVSAMA